MGGMPRALHNGHMTAMTATLAAMRATVSVALGRWIAVLDLFDLASRCWPRRLTLANGAEPPFRCTSIILDAE